MLDTGTNSVFHKEHVIFNITVVDIISALSVLRNFMSFSQSVAPHYVGLHSLYKMACLTRIHCFHPLYECIFIMKLRHWVDWKSDDVAFTTQNEQSVRL